MKNVDRPNYSVFPVLPIRNTVLFPGVTVPLRVGRPRSVAALLKAQERGGWILAITQKNDVTHRDPESGDLYLVGTLCKVERLSGTAESGFQVIARGVARYRVSDWSTEGDAMAATAEELADLNDTDPKTAEALLQSLKTLTGEILSLLPANTEALSELVEGIDDLALLSFLCAANLEIPLPKRQEILENTSLKGRTLALMTLLQAQRDGLQVQSEIRRKLTSKMGKLQREAILREHLKAIKEELGEGDSPTGREDYEKKIEEAGMPEEVRKVAEDELKRLRSLGNNSPEAHVISNYLDLLCAMPWNRCASSTIDLEAARKILDADHYGLETIKKRILQYLAVMKLKKGGRGSILLFVGPPGVGKTSLGQSIARALGRKFVRASLGGVRDDAEIRGHRRTYVGAMPGRIVQGLKRAGENNPVFMLDEIDKLSRSFQGDPASALLEVLDPAQNASFLDHYLDVPFDLSKVFFIATANTLETIPGPLLDRMEVIQLSGYTTTEKSHIARTHLIPKQLEEHGMTSAQLAISDEALNETITGYTREAGVRELERAIAAICRASSEKILSAKPGELPVRVEREDLDEILGPQKFQHEVAEKAAAPGVVTGLAWTPMGGEILFIETTFMPGSGQLTLTGQLGDVMKESAQIALSLVRSRLPQLAPDLEYKKQDLHVHVPAGSIPKDGPSAGVAILTSIASLFTGRRVDPKLAMTGEVTLRGTVMPVGGIKEKVIAAHRAGIERVILSKRNEKDLREVPDEVKRDVKIQFVENVADVLRIALGLEREAQAFTPGFHAPSPPAAA